MQDMTFKTPPMEHQLRALEASRDASAFALVMEQGTGKTKVIIDTAAYLYARGRINAVLVLCPSGLQRNWTRKEVDKHLPDHVPRRTFAWTRPPSTKREQRALEHLLEPGWDLRVLAMHYEAILTEKAKAYLRRFVSTLNVMIVADESHYLKNPNAKRTPLAWKIASACPYRRILTGTPITQGPLDVYGQFRFLEGREQGSIIPESRYTTFRAQYADTRKITLEGQGKNGRDIEFEVVENYKNLDELERVLAPYSFRVRKQDCLDLPDKVYRTRDVEMTARQRRLYQELLDQGAALLEPQPGQDPEEALWQALTDPDTPAVVAENALSLQMRLQQVLGGYVQPQDDAPLERIEGPNPRISAVLDEIEAYPVKTVVWCRFRHEVEAVAQAYRDAQGQHGTGYPVVYHGGVGADDRWANVQRFQEDPDCRLFVATPDTGARGIDLYAAGHTIFFSCSPNYEHRTQAEDRMHRQGFAGDVPLYTDLQAPDTVDERVVELLQNKDRLATAFQWGAGVA